MKLLVTGGTGYIGSHICVELLHQGHQVIIIDNLCNSNPVVLKKIEKITGKKIAMSESEIYDNVFYNNDIRDRKALQQRRRCHLEQKKHRPGIYRGTGSTDER